MGEGSNKKTPAEYLDEMRRRADANGGKLLSTEWLGARTKHRFAFADGREFENTPNKLKDPKRGWPKDPDAYLKTDEERLDELRVIADANDGKLLSEEWLGKDTKHRFVFSDGLEFEMLPSNLKNQGWPKNPDVYFKIIEAQAKPDEEKLAEIRAIAEANGGRLISTEWLGNQTKHRFAFEDGKEFEMLPNDLKSRGWPSGLGVSQERCHLAMEFIFGTEFARNVRSVLPGGLEFDGWNEDIRVAFEYQGDESHHLGEGGKAWHGRDHQKTQKDDAFKVKWCQKKGITLVVIDDLRGNGKNDKVVGWESQAVLRHVFEAVKETCLARSLMPPPFPENAEQFSARVDRYDLRKLAEIREIAEANGGKLVSEEWLSSQFPHRFAFPPIREGEDWREFEIRPGHLKSYGWPKDADAFFKQSAERAKSPEDLLADIRDIAEANGGRLLSTKWLGDNTKHRFAFADGREFEMRSSYLKDPKQGWPIDPDAFFKRSAPQSKSGEDKLAELSAMAEAHCGKLLSTKWLGALTNHRFAFEDGREFEIRPGHLKSYGWPKKQDLVARRFAERQQPGDENTIMATPTQIAPGIRDAHSDSFLSSTKKPSSVQPNLPGLNLAEHVKEFQAARTAGDRKPRAPI